MRKILFDPYQMVASAQRLSKAGLQIEEFAQTVSNLTAASQQLFELISGQSILLYPNAAMRLAMTRTVAVETSRGWRIAKEKQSHKIDIIIALAMAAYAAIQGQSESNFDTSWRWVDHDDGDLRKPESKQQRESAEARRRREEAESNYRWRMHNYFRKVGVF